MCKNKIFVYDIGRMRELAMKAGLKKLNKLYCSEGCV